MMLTFPLLLALFGAAAAVHNDYFTAAVFENRYFNDPAVRTRDEVLPPNIRVFQKAAEVAAAKGADILLFSEYGVFEDSLNRSDMKTLSEHIPDPKLVKTNPCNEQNEYENRPILVTFSCMAKEYGMYVVGNLVDIQPCKTEQQHCDATGDGIEGCSDTITPCPGDGDFLYNADAVFDRQGNLIARYHKNHLYFEVMDTPKPYEMVTFDTEFGKMGLFICFDSLWNEAAELVKKYPVDTVIYAAYWFDDMLPMTAVEWQQSWALANKVNFVVANGRHPDTGTLGSGIYSKDHGALVYTYSPDGKSRLLVARVPRGDALPSDEGTSVHVITEDELAIEEDPDDGTAFPDYCYDKLIGPAEVEEDYRCTKEQFSQRHAITKLVDKTGKAEVCHNGLCCSVSYTANKMDEDYYLAVYNGTNDIQGYFKWAEEDCFLVRCDPFEGRPCATLPSRASSTVFSYIELKATFSPTAHVHPTVSKLNYRLAPKSEFETETKDGKSVLTYRSNSDVPLLKAGLIGRVYERDPPFVPYYTF